MPRLSKNLIAQHEAAADLLESKQAGEFTQEEVFQILSDWNPSYGGHIQKNAAFFTPHEVADSLIYMTLNIEGRILDLGAGTGRLIYATKKHNYWRWDDVDEYVAVEINPEYVEVGRKLFPEVTWICGSMFDLDLLQKIGPVDTTISNPPFGKVPTTKQEISWLKYQGAGHLMAVEVAAIMSRRGAGFILPQQDLPWEYSGKQFYTRKRSLTEEFKKFERARPGIEFNCKSVDLSLYEWPEAPQCEIVGIDGPDYSDLLHVKFPDHQLSLFQGA